MIETHLSLRRNPGATRWISVALLAGGLVSAQQSPSKWAGEWGRITKQATGIGVEKYVGGRLDISDCWSDGCKMQIVNYKGPRGYCSAQGELTIKSPLTAEVTLQASVPAGGCALALNRSKSGAVISATESSGICSSFCIGSASFRSTFPFRQKTPFVGNDIDGCFLGTSPARSTICGDADLAQLEWKLILLENMPPAMEDEMLRKCDGNKRRAECLRKAFTNSISENERGERNMAIDATTPGDPQVADALIEKISGEYRSTFENSDISGDEFTSPDYRARVENRDSLQRCPQFLQRPQLRPKRGSAVCAEQQFRFSHADPRR